MNTVPGENQDLPQVAPRPSNVELGKKPAWAGLGAHGDRIDETPWSVGMPYRANENRSNLSDAG